MYSYPGYYVSYFSSKKEVVYSYLGVLNAGLSDFDASSIRGITIFSIESVRRENVGSTMKSMKPEGEEEKIFTALKTKNKFLISG